MRLNRENLPKLRRHGLATGALSGFFGIGGGFLIVPGLMLASGMPILNAVASSCRGDSVRAHHGGELCRFGFVHWTLSALFVAGGVLGGIAGAQLAATLGDSGAR